MCALTSFGILSCILFLAIDLFVKCFLLQIVVLMCVLFQRFLDKSLRSGFC